jgi:neocarzinostatin family protein
VGGQVRIVNFPRRWAAAAVLAVLAAGCGSSPAPVVRSPTITPPAATTTAPPTATPSAATTIGHAQHVTVTPATGLTAGQRVLVQASGFSPGESLVVTECASKGTATGPGDCDLTSMQGVTADASGRVKLELTVSKGPFGVNKILCGPAQACLVSVTQATPSPTQEADAPIAFRLSMLSAYHPGHRDEHRKEGLSSPSGRRHGVIGRRARRAARTWHRLCRC